MSSSPPIRCTHCDAYRESSLFRTNRLGRQYATCSLCSSRLTSRRGLQARGSQDRAQQPTVPITGAIPPQTRRCGRPPRQPPMPLPLRSITPHSSQPLPTQPRLNQVAPIQPIRIADPEPVRHAKPPGFLSCFIQAAPHNLGRLDHECEYCTALH